MQSPSELTTLCAKLFDPHFHPSSRRPRFPPRPPSLRSSPLNDENRHSVGLGPVWRARRFRMWRDQTPPLRLVVLDARRRENKRRFACFATPSALTIRMQSRTITRRLDNPFDLSSTSSSPPYTYTVPPALPRILPASRRYPAASSHPPSPPPVPHAPPAAAQLITSDIGSADDTKWDPTSTWGASSTAKYVARNEYERMQQHKFILEQEHERRFRLAMKVLTTGLIEFQRTHSNFREDGEKRVEWHSDADETLAAYYAQLCKDITKSSSNAFAHIAMALSPPRQTPSSPEAAGPSCKSAKPDTAASYWPTPGTTITMLAPSAREAIRAAMASIPLTMRGTPLVDVPGLKVAKDNVENAKEGRKRRKEEKAEKKRLKEELKRVEEKKKRLEDEVKVAKEELKRAEERHALETASGEIVDGTKDQVSASLSSQRPIRDEHTHPPTPSNSALRPTASPNPTSTKPLKSRRSRSRPSSLHLPPMPPSSHDIEDDHHPPLTPVLSRTPTSPTSPRTPASPSSSAVTVSVPVFTNTDVAALVALVSQTINLGPETDAHALVTAAIRSLAESSEPGVAELNPIRTTSEGSEAWRQAPSLTHSLSSESSGVSTPSTAVYTESLSAPRSLDSEHSHRSTTPSSPLLSLARTHRPRSTQSQSRPSSTESRSSEVPDQSRYACGDESTLLDQSTLGSVDPGEVYVMRRGKWVRESEAGWGREVPGTDMTLGTEQGGVGVGMDQWARMVPPDSDKDTVLASGVGGLSLEDELLTSKRGG